MSMEEIKEHFGANRWYDCSEVIKRMARESKLSVEEAEEVGRTIAGVFHRMHPATISEVSVALAGLLSTGNAVQLLETAAGSIVEMMNDEIRYANELIYVRMHICLCKITDGDLGDRESEILEWLDVYSKDDSNTSDIPFSQRNYALLQYAAYRFYAGIGHVERAQTHLLCYLEEGGDTKLMAMLIKLSIISESFFNFSAISHLPGFSDFGDSSLLSLFNSYHSGSVEGVRGAEAQIGEILQEVTGGCSDGCVQRVIEKIYLVKILGICFASERKFVPFSLLIDELQLQSCDALIFLLLKALGNRLVAGHIDTADQRLYFDRLMPRTLTDGDLAKMKTNFALWKERIARVIKEVEAK